MRNRTKWRLADWMHKAYDEALLCRATTVALIPSRTNTNWWHEYCMKAPEICFLRGRPKFGGAKHGLPQPLALVIFQKGLVGDAMPVIGISGLDIRSLRPIAATTPKLDEMEKK